MKQQWPDNARRRGLMGAAGALTLLSAAGRAAERTAPSSLTIVCGYAAGGTSDQLCRQVAAKLAPGFAETAIVENKTGAQAQLSIVYVKGQPADGSCILQATMSMFSLFPRVYSKLPYDTADFVPLTAGCQVEYAYAVGPLVPESVRNVEQYVAWARQDPVRRSFGAVGQIPTIVGTLLGKSAGIDLVPVQYRGGAPAAQETLGGNIGATVTTIGDLLPFLSAGKLRLLATTGDKRNAAVPTVPTFAEQGVSDVVVKNYFAFFVRSGTPAKRVTDLSNALRAALTHKDVVDAMRRVAMEVVPSDPVQTAEMMVKDRAQWAAYVDRTGYQAPV